MSPQNAPRTVVQLRIELLEVEPAVWRRLLVPGGVKLAKLHEMLQAAMGWSDSHLHAFRFGATIYGMLDDEEDDEEEGDEAAATLLDALDEGNEPIDEFVYEYDFGDGWEHRVTVERRLPEDTALRVAVCLDGQHACPPEDVGGPDGYAAFLVAMADPSHEEHVDFMEWVGGPFDPTWFDLGEANVALQRIR
jgi:hypothetical protein